MAATVRWDMKELSAGRWSSRLQEVGQQCAGNLAMPVYGSEALFYYYSKYQFRTFKD